MKLASRFLAAGFLIGAVILFASWSDPPKDAETNAAPVRDAKKAVKELVLEPSYKPVLVLNDKSNGCLFCHGPTYEDLREKTKDYVYNGEKLQPHTYLDMSKKKPHDSTNPIDCLQCHVEHEMPAPTGPVKKPTLDYCINCHHTGNTGPIEACSDCHGDSTP